MKQKPGFRLVVSGRMGAIGNGGAALFVGLPIHLEAKTSGAGVQFLDRQPSVRADYDGMTRPAIACTRDF